VDLSKSCGFVVDLLLRICYTTSCTSNPQQIEQVEFELKALYVDLQAHCMTAWQCMEALIKQISHYLPQHNLQACEQVLFKNCKN
jgi:hypothetical protein